MQALKGTYSHGVMTIRDLLVYGLDRFLLNAAAL